MPPEPATPPPPNVRPEPAWRPALRAALSAAVLVAALFCLVVSLLLFGLQARLVRLDPLNSPALMEPRSRLAAAPDDEALKHAVRAADRQARETFFFHHERIALGSRLLLGGALLLVTGLAALPLLREPNPDVARLKGPR